jgi:2-oxoglutarate ferredoxin oxidoreductase subunit delta
LAYIEIEKEACKGCMLCAKACNKGVIEFQKESNGAGFFAAYPAKNENCIGCTLCAVMCPDVCIRVFK